jgi:hypothetical protein
MQGNPKPMGLLGNNGFRCQVPGMKIAFADI